MAAIGTVLLRGLLAWGLVLQSTASSPLAGADDGDAAPTATTTTTCPDTFGPDWRLPTPRDPLWNEPSATTTVAFTVVFQGFWPIAGWSENTIISLATTLAEDPATATAYPHVFRRTMKTKYVTLSTDTETSASCTSTTLGVDYNKVTHTFTAFLSDPTHMDASATDFATVPCPGVVPGDDDAGAKGATVGEGGQRKEVVVEEDNRDNRDNDGHEDCVALGMETGCIGQCALGGANNDLFICPDSIHVQVRDLSMGMGRVCWLPNGTMHALNTPCLKVDHGVACTPGYADYRPGFRPSLWI